MGKQTITVDTEVHKLLGEDYKKYRAIQESLKAAHAAHAGEHKSGVTASSPPPPPPPPPPALANAVPGGKKKKGGSKSTTPTTSTAVPPPPQIRQGEGQGVSVGTAPKKKKSPKTTPKAAPA